MRGSKPCRKECGTGEGEGDKASRGGDKVEACMRNSGKPPTLELDKRINLQLTGNLNI